MRSFPSLGPNQHTVEKSIIIILAIAAPSKEKGGEGVGGDGVIIDRETARQEKEASVRRNVETRENAQVPRGDDGAGWQPVLLPLTPHSLFILSPANSRPLVPVNHGKGEGNKKKTLGRPDGPRNRHGDNPPKQG